MKIDHIEKIILQEDNEIQHEKEKKEQNSSPQNDGWYCDERRKKVPTFGARARLMISFPSCHIMERQNEKKIKL